MRFEILKALYAVAGPMDERQELINTIIGAAAILVGIVVFAWMSSISMLIAIVPGLAGVLFGETVYYGWERIQQQREEEHYRELMGE